MPQTAPRKPARCVLCTGFLHKPAPNGMTLAEKHFLSGAFAAARYLVGGPGASGLCQRHEGLVRGMIQHANTQAEQRNPLDASELS